MSPDFRLYEALLWEPPEGYFLLEEHLRRLRDSADYFHFALEPEAVRARLSEFAASLPKTSHKVRLEVSCDGALRLEHQDLKPGTQVRAELAREPVDSSDPFLRHKTSRRQVFERALAAHPHAQDVLLFNERGELTETCNANLVLEIDGQRLTPPLSCGLLPGTFRRHLLERGELREQILPIAALEQASALFLINSVRRCCAIQLQRPAARRTP